MKSRAPFGARLLAALPPRWPPQGGAKSRGAAGIVATATRIMLLGRAKSCRWQVFVRRRPPKQGELRTDVSKATMFQGDRAAKGFNFVSGKLLFGWADSRFRKPRISLRGVRVVTFCVVQKVTKKHAGLRPATSIQISVRFGAFTEMTDQHQVTGYGENRRASGYRR